MERVIQQMQQGSNMEQLINKLCEGALWNQWVAVNSGPGAGCISTPKEGCISVAQIGVGMKTGCIS